MGGNFGIMLRGLALVALLWLAWSQLRSRRVDDRSQRDHAISHGDPALVGNRELCRDAAALLGERGIRSWCIRRDDQWAVIVDIDNHTEAQRVLMPCFKNT